MQLNPANWLLRLYRLILSPALHLLWGTGMGCRFEPTCSHYAQEAIAVHGYRRGGWLTLIRLSRCHPWTSAGFDPVPDGIASPHGS